MRKGDPCDKGNRERGEKRLIAAQLAEHLARLVRSPSANILCQRSPASCSNWSSLYLPVSSPWLGVTSEKHGFSINVAINSEHILQNSLRNILVSATIQHLCHRYLLPSSAVEGLHAAGFPWASFAEENVREG